MEEARRSLQKNQSQQAKKEQELEELKRELTELEKAWKASERQMEEEEAQRGAGVQLEEAQVKMSVLWTVFLKGQQKIALENNNRWNKVVGDLILSIQAVLNSKKSDIG